MSGGVYQLDSSQRSLFSDEFESTTPLRLHHNQNERNGEQRHSLPVKFTVNSLEERKDDSGSSYSSMEALNISSSSLISESALHHHQQQQQQHQQQQQQCTNNTELDSSTSHDFQGNNNNPVFFFESVRDNSMDDITEDTTISTTTVSTTSTEKTSINSSTTSTTSASSPSSKFLDTTNLLSSDHRRISLPNFNGEQKQTMPFIRSKLSASLRSLINTKKETNKTCQSCSSDTEKDKLFNNNNKKLKNKKTYQLRKNLLSGSYGSIARHHDTHNDLPRCVSVEPEVFATKHFADKPLHDKDIKKRSSLDDAKQQLRKEMTLSDNHDQHFIKRSSLSLNFFSRKHHNFSKNAEQKSKGKKKDQSDAQSEDNVIIYSHASQTIESTKKISDGFNHTGNKWRDKDTGRGTSSSDDACGKKPDVKKTKLEKLSERYEAKIMMVDDDDDENKNDKNGKRVPKVVIHYVKSASAINNANQEQYHQTTTTQILTSNTSPQFPLEYIQESSTSPTNDSFQEPQMNNKKKFHGRPRVGSIDSTDTLMNSNNLPSTSPTAFFQTGPDPSGSELEGTNKFSDTCEQSQRPQNHHHHHHHNHSSPGKIIHHKSSGSGSKSGGDGSGKSGKLGLEKKKKTSSWYNHKKLVLSPSYKSRSEDFKRIFKALPNDERLIVDYSCALQKDILIQGRMYVSQSWICFYANIFRWETVLMIKCKDIMKLTKEKTARVIPNAIQISTRDDKYFFASFGARDKVFLQLDLVRRNATNGLYMSKPEFWSWVHFYYGDDLALTSDDEDYVPLTSDDKNRFQMYLQMELGQENNGVVDVGKEVTETSIATSLTTSSNWSPTTTCTTNNIDMLLNDDVESVSDMGSPVAMTKDRDGEGLMDYRECQGTEDEESSSGDDLVDYCSKHSHFSIDVLDEAYDMTVDDVFHHCFSDSQIYREFIKAKKTFDVSLNPWSDQLDSQGCRTRDISYTLTLDFSIGPKHSPSVEKQVMHSESEPGHFYLIDSECFNEGIPYGENFFITNRYCISRLSDKRSRLKITSQINYRKNVWGFIKNFLEKNVTAGIISTFNVLADLLRLESDRQLITLTQSSPSLKRHSYLRRRVVGGDVVDGVDVINMASTSLKGQDLPSKQGSIHGITRIRTTKSIQPPISQSTNNKSMFTMDVLVRLVCFVLIILMFFNAIFFYKLWSLEKSATNLLRSKFTSTPDDDLLSTLPPSMTANPLVYRRDVYEDFLKKPHQSEKKLKDMLADDWIKSSQSHHKKVWSNSDIDQWKNILSSSIRLMDHMRMSLIQLRNKLDRVDDDDDDDGGGADDGHNFDEISIKKHPSLNHRDRRK